MSMTYEQIKDNATIQTYIAQADKSLAALGFTEHSFAHVGMVAEKAGIQVGMGVVVAVTVLLLITILFSVFTKGGNEE